MDKKDKELTLKRAVEHGTLQDVQAAFTQYALYLDDSYLDYELLKSALLRGNCEIANYLLTLGCRIKRPDEKNSEEPLLHVAVKNVERGIDELAITLISKGASIYEKNASGDTPLVAAFKAQRYSGINALLKPCMLCLDPTNEDDVAHFQVAIVSGVVFYNYSVLHTFLDAQFDPNATFVLNLEKYDGLNPVNFAIRTHIIELYHILLEKCDLSVRDYEGLTPLHSIYYFIEEPEMELWMDWSFKSSNDLSLNNCKDDQGLTHFHLCCMLNQPELTQAFIDNGASVHTPVSFTKSSKNAGFTPLHFALRYNRFPEVIKVLLKNGADPNKKDKRGRTPLHLVTKKHIIIDEFLCDLYIFEMIKIMLDSKANPTIPDEKGRTPLLILFEYFHCNYKYKRNTAEIASKTPFGSINYTDKFGISLFHVACAMNLFDQVVQFLDAGVVDINGRIKAKRNARGYTALHLAAMHKHADIVQELLRRNADVNVRTHDSSRTPLHLACECNLKREKFRGDQVVADQLKIVRLLISHGADVNARDSSGFTPLLRTCVIKKPDRIYLNSSFVGGESALIRSIRDRWYEIFKILSLNKADASARTNNRASIFKIMSVNKCLKIQEKIDDYLLVLGVDVNALDDSGNTLLHLAVSNFNIGLTVKLLECGVDVNVKNCSGDCFISTLLNNPEWSYYWPELFGIIYIHVQKLMALGLPLSQSVKNRCAQLHSLYKMESSIRELPIIDNTFKECVNELDRMKNVVVDRYTSLYDILLKSPQELTMHVKNDGLWKFLNNSNVEKDFPNYSYLLKLQCKRGSKRSDVLQYAAEALSNIFKTHLPAACYEAIFKYLNDEDVARLKEVALGKVATEVM